MRLTALGGEVEMAPEERAIAVKSRSNSTRRLPSAAAQTQPSAQRLTAVGHLLDSVLANLPSLLNIFLTESAAAPVQLRFGAWRARYERR